MSETRNFDCPETQTKCKESNCLLNRCVLMLRENSSTDHKQHPAKSKLIVPVSKTEEEKLKRKIQTIGMEFFVTFYPLLRDIRISDDELVRIIRRTRGYAEIASNVRASESRKLINDGRSKDVFRIIAKARQVDEAIRQKAMSFFASN